MHASLSALRRSAALVAPLRRAIAVPAPLRRAVAVAAQLRRAVHFRAPVPAPAPGPAAPGVQAASAQAAFAPASQPHASPAPIVVEDFVVTSPHRRHTHAPSSPEDAVDRTLPHAVYTTEEALALRTDVHYTPANFRDRSALFAITTVRRAFDFVTGYKPGSMTAQKYLTRIVFLETVAGVPGFVAAMVRHLQSLRLMRRDGGYIHTLLQEAENERMHLLTFLSLHKPDLMTRILVLLAQGIATNAFFAAYLFAPRWCHRFVGFLEEEAVHTYTNCLKDIDEGRLPEWKHVPAPPIAIKYWRLAKDATLRDVILAVRADEAIHRDVNHVYASLKEGERNPFEA
jgi:hypothetical protein